VGPTQRVLEPDQVAALVAASCGSRMADGGPLAGGSFTTVWWVDLDDGRAVVLKVAPPPEVPLLGYERGLLAAEARYYRLVAARAPELPLPRVLHVGDDPALLDGGWMVMTRLPGRPLPELTGQDDTAARRDLGAVLARLHAVTGDRYGYDGDGRATGPTWRAAFTAMVDDLLRDAATWDVALPAAPARIRGLVDAHADVLDLVTRPAPVHFDAWDGNVLAAPGPDGRLRLTGLVDGERFLYGDPLVDLVSPHLWGRIEDEPEHPVLAGYRPTPVLDAPARRRLLLYRMHLYLLMAVEMPSRGMFGPAWQGRRDGIGALLDHQLGELGRR
jgi:aminoglycoside phosphotransferase (APT) family kinase protein